MLPYPRGEQAGAFDVVNDLAAGDARQYIGREEHQLAVRVDDFAVLGDDAEAVAVAVEGDADFGVGFTQGADDVFKIFRLRRVRVVVREIAVDFAEQRHDLATEALEQFRGDRTGDAVAAIHDDFHRPRQLDIADDLVDIGGADVGAAPLTLAVLEVAGFGAPLQVLDGVEGQRRAADDHFQAVVVGWVMAAGDRDAGIAAQFVGGEIGDRGRHATDIDGVHPGGADAVHQRTGQFGAGQAAVAADSNGALALFGGQRAEGVADPADDVGGQRFVDDASNVVGLEDFSGELAHDFWAMTFGK